MTANMMPHKGDKFAIYYNNYNGYISVLGAINAAEMIEIVDQLTENGLKVYEIKEL